MILAKKTILTRAILLIKILTFCVKLRKLLLPEHLEASYTNSLNFKGEYSEICYWHKRSLYM